MSQSEVAAEDEPTAFLLSELPLLRPTKVVDVGANPVNEAPYSGLLRMGGCHVIGFEPQPSAFAELQKIKSDLETYHCFAVGDGSAQDLNIFRDSGLASVFPPYAPGMRIIGQPGWAKVLDRIAFDTVALDKVDDIAPFDLLKIDIQGGENMVFRGGAQVIKTAVCIIVELRYMRLYQDEPMMGGVDEELRRQGFYLHKFLSAHSKMVPNSQAARLRRRRVSDQLLDGDAVYLRNIAEMNLYDDAQVMHLAILSASVLASHSLTIHCLDELVRRGLVAPHLPERYVDLLPQHLRSD